MSDAAGVAKGAVTSQEPPIHDAAQHTGPPAAKKRKVPGAEVWRVVRRWPKVTGWAFALMTGILMSGVGGNITSGITALPEFQLAFGGKSLPTQPGSHQQKDLQLIFPAVWLSLWNLAVPVGAIAGGLVGGYVPDKLGRRFGVAMSSVLALTFATVAFVADRAPSEDARRAVFLVARLGQGFAHEMILCTAETALSEILPPPLRAVGIALYPITTILGQIIGAGIQWGTLPVPGPNSYRIAFATIWPFALAPLVVAKFFPETAPWLLRVGREDDARRSHARLDSSPHQAEREAAFQELQRTVQLEREQTSFREVGYWECFRDPIDRRRTTITILVRLIPMFFGMPLASTGAGYFLQTIGISARLSVLFMLLGAGVALLCNFISFFNLIAFGRRSLLLASLAAATLIWTSVGIAGSIPNQQGIIYAGVGLLLVIAAITMAAWPACHVVAAEVSSLRLRARSQAIACVTTSITGAGFSVGLPYIYNPDQGNQGARVGYIFAALCAVSIAIVWKTVPEMKGRTPAEIDEMFELKLPARAFQRWTAPRPSDEIDTAADEEPKEAGTRVQAQA